MSLEIEQRKQDADAQVWDPFAAYKAKQVAAENRQKSVEVRETLAQIAGAHIVDKAITRPIDSRSLVERIIAEHVLLLDASAEEADLVVESYGGEAAVSAHERSGYGISYAGETPARIYPNPPANLYNRPA